jgi:hypothetical protein
MNHGTIANRIQILDKVCIVLLTIGLLLVIASEVINFSRVFSHGIIIIGACLVYYELVRVPFINKMLCPFKDQLEIFLKNQDSKETYKLIAGFARDNQLPLIKIDIYKLQRNYLKYSKVGV